MLRSRVQVSAFLPVDMVTLATALEIFNEHDLQPSDRAMDVVEVIHCLTALYERLEEERGILVNVPLCVDMSLNWLLNVFDRYRPRGAVLRGKTSAPWPLRMRWLVPACLADPPPNKTTPVLYLALQRPQREDEGPLLQDGHCMSVRDGGQGKIPV